MKTIGSVTLIAPMLAVLLSLAGATNVKADPVPDVPDRGTSGVANDGTLIGNTSLSTDAALGNGALRSEPVSGAADTTRMSVGGDLTDLDMTGSYTFMAWLKVLSDGNKGIIQLGACCTAPPGGSSLQAREGYTLNYISRGLRFWGGSSNADVNHNLFTGSVLNLNQYHHIAVRVQPGDVEIFVDGVSVASGGASNIPTSPSKVNPNNNLGPGAPSIGGSNVSTPHNTADVLIDEVRVYGSAVSDADIALIAAGNIGPLPDRLYYDFEEPNCFVIDAIDDEFSVINDGTSADFSVLANDECSDDTPISVVELPGDLLPDRGGSAATDGETVSYTPAAGFVGFEEFTYTAQDAGLEGGDDPPTVDQDTALIEVEVLEDILPDAVDDGARTLLNQSITIDVLENDSLGNAPNVVGIETAPANGSATLQAGDTIRYVPNFDFFGEDGFEYRLTDANGDSDVATVTVGVFFERGPVPIDIMPADPGNNVNLRAGSGASISIAILSVSGFEAPLIDRSTLKFGPGQASISGKPRVRDMDGDGVEDLLVKFLTGETGIACGDTQASLSGETFDFQLFSGTDAINTFACPRTRKRY